MQFPTLKQKFSKALRNNTVLMVTTFGLLVIVILQQFKINAQHERIVLVPPNLTEKAQISWSTASQGYLNNYALYIVSQISAATPSTVEYTAMAMEPYFNKDIWSSLLPQLMAIKNNPNYAGVNPVSNFSPVGGIIFEPETNKIFVVGKLTSSAYSRGMMQNIGVVDATYELEMFMTNGLPKVKSFYAYTGLPKTLAWAKKNQEKAKIEEKRRQTAVVPMVPESEIKSINDGFNQLSISTPDEPVITLPDASQAAQEVITNTSQEIVLPEPSTTPTQVPNDVGGMNDTNL